MFLQRFVKVAVILTLTPINLHVGVPILDVTQACGFQTSCGILYSEVKKSLLLEQQERMYADPLFLAYCLNKSREYLRYLGMQFQYNTISY